MSTQIFLQREEVAFSRWLKHSQTSPPAPWRHRDEIVVHLDTLLEKFDVVLQKRLQVYNLSNLGLDCELSDIGIFGETPRI